jgi:hypothetical protein
MIFSFWLGIICFAYLINRRFWANPSREDNQFKNCLYFYPLARKIRCQQDSATMGTGRGFTHRKPSLIFNRIGEHPDISLWRNTLDGDLIGQTGRTGTKPLFWLVLVRFATGFGDNFGFRKINMHACGVHISSVQISFKKWLDIRLIYDGLRCICNVSIKEYR